MQKDLLVKPLQSLPTPEHDVPVFLRHIGTQAAATWLAG